MLWIKSPNLSDATGALLHDTLKKAFYKTEDLVEIWIFIGMDPAEIEWQGSAAQLWRTLTYEAAAKDHLQDLIECVRSRRPALAIEFDYVLAAVLPQQSWYFCKSPFESNLIGPGRRQAVLNRYLLRSRVANIANDDYPVLNIKGPQGSGRSFSRRILQHVAHHPTVSADLIVVDAAVDLPDPAHAADLVRALGIQLGLNVPLDQVDAFTEEKRKAYEAVALLVGEYRRLQQSKRWIFLDSLDRPHVKSDVHSAVGHLARKIESGQFGSTRLIVTGYPEDFPPEVMEVLQEETISTIGIPEGN